MTVMITGRALLATIFVPVADWPKARVRVAADSQIKLEAQSANLRQTVLLNPGI